MTDTTTTEPVETEDTQPDPEVEQQPTDNGQETDQTEPETFPRAYVEKLRREAAEHRTRAADRDSLAERLHVALVAATNRLADPTDLPYNPDHLTDPDALTAAVEALVTRKPHLTSRRPTGDVGQGATGLAGSVDLAGLLRARA